jgi:hypothetical protein
MAWCILALASPKKGAIKLIWATLIKDYIRMLHTKVGGHPSISPVKGDVYKFLLFLDKLPL